MYVHNYMQILISQCSNWPSVLVCFVQVLMLVVVWASPNLSNWKHPSFPPHQVVTDVLEVVTDVQEVLTEVQEVLSDV